MFPTTLQLLDLCNRVYDRADLVAGHGGIDGASVFNLPNDVVVLVFRGTLANHDLQSAIDWLNDFHADLVEADGFPGKVHRGFLDSLNALWDDVFVAVEGFRPKPPPLPPLPTSSRWNWNRLREWFFGPDIFGSSIAEQDALPLPWKKHLVITGHSKGGALAQLAAIRFAELNPVVVTFGAPLVGDSEFAKLFPKTVSLVRFEGARDLVPLLPGVLFGYHETPGDVRVQNGFSRKWRELAIGAMLAEGGWDQLSVNHGLLTGYAPWCQKDPPPTESAAKAA